MTSGKLLEALRTGSVAQRTEALRKMGPAKPDMPPAVLDALCKAARRDSDPGVRLLAVEALARLGRLMSFASRDALIDALTLDGDEQVRAGAADALRQFGDHPPAKIVAALQAYATASVVEQEEVAIPERDDGDPTTALPVPRGHDRRVSEKALAFVVYAVLESASFRRDIGTCAREVERRAHDTSQKQFMYAGVVPAREIRIRGLSLPFRPGSSLTAPRTTSRHVTAHRQDRYKNLRPWQNVSEDIAVRTTAYLFILRCLAQDSPDIGRYAGSVGLPLATFTDLITDVLQWLEQTGPGLEFTLGATALTMRCHTLWYAAPFRHEFPLGRRSRQAKKEPMPPAHPAVQVGWDGAGEPVSGHGAGDGSAALVGREESPLEPPGDAPVRRHPLFQRGDTVRVLSTHEPGQVIRAVHHDGALAYDLTLGEQRASRRIRVLETDLVTPTNDDPARCLVRGHLETAEDFALRVAALRLAHAYASDDLVRLSSARVEPLPHQVGVAHRTLRERLEPRMLLADEVGLGKTIEAGLILKELRARGQVQRTLIITPANLVGQWREELSDKFNEEFTALRGQDVAELRRRQPTANPWLIASNIICSRQLIARRRSKEGGDAVSERKVLEFAETLGAVEWDLVIVDEAHHVRRRMVNDKVVSTNAYEILKKVRTKSLLLLTATPMQLDAYELYALLDLLDPSVFRSYWDLYVYTHVIGRFVNSTAEALQRWGSLNDEERRATLARCRMLLGPPAVSGSLHAASGAPVGEQIITWSERQQWLQRLSDMHLLSRLMTRNRKRDIGGFADRRVALLEVTLSPQELAIHRAVSTYIRTQYDLASHAENKPLGFVMATFQRLLASSPRALTQALRRRMERLEDALKRDSPRATVRPSHSDTADELPPELVGLVAYQGGGWRKEVQEEIATLRRLVHETSNLPADTKLQRLLREVRRVLSANPRDKLLIFTTFKGTLEYLREALAPLCDVAVFHGGLDPSKKDHEVERFRGAAAVMIATEAGGEGRNFQFCHHVYNYDLPWNPMKVEQRIGRVDRLGQSQQVLVHNFAAPQTIDGRIIKRLLMRIRLFEETVGGLDPILDGEITRQIEKLALSGDSCSDAEIDRVAVEIEKMKRQRARERDDLLRDFTSFAGRDGGGLDGETLAHPDRRPKVTSGDIQTFVFGVLKRYPSLKAPDEIEPGIWRITVPDVLTKQLGLAQGYSPAVFDPRLALHHPKATFLTFGHPLVDALVRYFGETDTVRPGAAIRHLQDADLAGFEGVQVFFQVEYTGLRTWQQLHCVIVDRGGNSDSALTQCVMRARDDRLREDGRKDPLLAHTGTKAAEKALQVRLAAEQVKMAAENDALYRRELRRLERLHLYNLQRVRNEVDDTRHILSRLESSTDVDDRRVLGLYRRRLITAEAAVKTVEQEAADARADLNQRRQVLCSYRIRGAALVYGPHVME